MMTELVLSALLVIPLITGSAIIIEKAYTRLECSRKVFEAARTALYDGFHLDPLTRVTRSKEGVRASRKCGAVEEEIFLPHLDERGSLTLPLVGLTVIIVVSMLTLLSLSTLWRSRVLTQKRIDTCIELHAKELRNTIDTLESGNLRIKLERASLATAMILDPPAVPVIRGIIRTEVLFQESLRTKWFIRQGKWIVKRGCDGKNDAFFPLPSMPWKRPPPDGISEQPLEWTGSKRLKLRLWNSPRYAAATVEMNSDGKWNARWSSPFKN